MKRCDFKSLRILITSAFFIFQVFQSLRSDFIPIIFYSFFLSEKACDDQFALCSEYAKNNYCTDYKKQMETQCRKSCNFCSKFHLIMQSIHLFFSFSLKKFLNNLLLVIVQLDISFHTQRSVSHFHPYLYACLFFFAAPEGPSPAVLASSKTIDDDASGSGDLSSGSGDQGKNLLPSLVKI